MICTYVASWTTSEVRSKSIICFSWGLLIFGALTQALKTLPAFETTRLLVRRSKCGNCLMIGVIFDQSSPENSSERWRQTRDAISSSSSSSLVERILTIGDITFELKMYERFWDVGKKFEWKFRISHPESKNPILPCSTPRQCCLSWIGSSIWIV